MTAQSDSQRAQLDRVSECVQCGKADASVNVPVGTRGQPGVAELVDALLAEGVAPATILHDGLMRGVQIIGRRFSVNEVYIPEVLIAARAMHAGMNRLKPFFAERGAPSRGVFLLGTVQGDLHDIGKNLVAMMVAGAGWNVVDLGIDCRPEKFLSALAQHPGAAVGLSALLTTTMVTMRTTVAAIRASSPATPILVGGAPVTAAFAREIDASAYAADPAGAIDALDRLVPAA